MTRDDICQEVMRLHMAYMGEGNKADSPDQHPDAPGVDFYRVGHNSSHEFYLGVAEDGTLWKRAWADVPGYDVSPEEVQRLYAEKLWDELAEHTTSEIEDDVWKYERGLADLGYIGHY